MVVVVVAASHDDVSGSGMIQCGLDAMIDCSLIN